MPEKTSNPLARSNIRVLRDRKSLRKQCSIAVTAPLCLDHSRYGEIDFRAMEVEKVYLGLQWKKASNLYGTFPHRGATERQYHL